MMLRVLLGLLVLTGCADLTGVTPPGRRATGAEPVAGSINLSLCFRGDSLPALLAGLPPCP